MPGLLSQIENDLVVDRFRAWKFVAFVLAVSVLAGSAESGWPFLLSPAMVSAAEANAFDTVAAEIAKSVTELGYSKDVAQDLVRLARDWKCEVWQQAISQARQRYQQKQISLADVALVEEAVIQGLCQTIGKEIAPCREEEGLKYFYLSKAVKDKKAQDLGYSQLVYILGNSLGLRVTAIGVLQLASGDLLSGEPHAACCVELTDGTVTMVDVTAGLVSKSFVFPEMYHAAGNYWELKQKDNPFGIYRRIQIWNKSGLCGAIYSNLGTAYDEAGDHAQAISCFTKAIELNPQYADAYNNRGNAYSISGQLSHALSDYAKAIELNPKLAHAYYNRGVAYERSGQRANALADYTKAIELNAKYTLAYCNRGNVYQESGQLDTALADFTKAIELNPKDADAYNNRGITYSKSGQSANALSDYAKAIELNPKLADAYYNRGVAYDRAGQLSNALSDFTKAVELNPRDADACYNRGLVHAKMGKTIEARHDLQKAATLNPAKKEQITKISDRFKLGL